MASIDSVSLTILFGAVLVLAGIMSSLVALRFGAPLLLVFLLVGLLAGESGIGGVKRPGIVHRLDKDTSGVMVVAKTLQAQTALVAQLSERDVHRQYLAVVVGALVSGGTANAAIDRHPRDRLRMAVREDGRDATTHFRLRERFRAHTALECRLETGRTHQIRVHMQHLRHPIVGDPKYFSKENWELPGGMQNRLHLLARRIVVPHPRGGTIDITAPLPPHMQQSWNLIGLDPKRYDPIEEAPEE